MRGWDSGYRGSGYLDYASSRLAEEDAETRERLSRQIASEDRATRGVLCPRGHLYDAIHADGRKVCLTCHREHVRRWRAKQ
jgi:hypothetical protein